MTIFYGNKEIFILIHKVYQFVRYVLAKYKPLMYYNVFKQVR